MSNKVKNIDKTNCMYYFFNDIMNIKSPLYLIFCKMNENFEEINNHKYLANLNKYLVKNKYLVPTNESTEKIEKYEEIWSKIKHLIGSITKNSDDYDEKYMTIKINQDDELPLNKTTEISSMIIVVRAVYHENKKYYAQQFLDECFYKLQTPKLS